MVQVAKAVTKTAIDALNAKISALLSGHVPVQENGVIYHQLLTQTAQYIHHLHQQERQTTVDEVKQVENSGEVDLLEILKKRTRQTPLVNAGYAIRVAIVSTTLSRYIRSVEEQYSNTTSYSVDKEDDVINVVILGCGLDVLGEFVNVYIFKYPRCIF